MNSNTHHNSGALIVNEVVTTTHPHTGLKPTLLNLDPIVEELYPSVFSTKNMEIAAEGDDVVAAGDSSEDARLNVHRSVAASWSVRIIKLNRDSVIYDNRICHVPSVLKSANHLEGQVSQSLFYCCWKSDVQLSSFLTSALHSILNSLLRLLAASWF